MSNEIQMTDRFDIGENDQSYKFAVANIGKRWVGFAYGALENGDRMLFMFPSISEESYLGLEDRELVIKLTGAIAQDYEHGYGGIERWFIPEELRGKPDDFRCEHCERIG